MSAMNIRTSDIKNFRLALSGALIGVAIVGLIHAQLPYDDAIGELRDLLHTARKV